MSNKYRFGALMLVSVAACSAGENGAESEDAADPQTAQGTSALSAYPDVEPHCLAVNSTTQLKANCLIGNNSDISSPATNVQFFFLPDGSGAWEALGTINVPPMGPWSNYTLPTAAYNHGPAQGWMAAHINRNPNNLQTGVFSEMYYSNNWKQWRTTVGNAICRYTTYSRTPPASGCGWAFFNTRDVSWNGRDSAACGGRGDYGVAYPCGGPGFRESAQYILQ